MGFSNEELYNEFIARGYKGPVQFWTHPDVFIPVKKLLVDNYSLVPPKFPHTDCLVYEDESGMGRWRTTFVKDDDLTGRIMFRYWWTRFNQEMLDKNPMKEPMEEVYQYLKKINKLDDITDMCVKKIEFP